MAVLFKGGIWRVQFVDVIPYKAGDCLLYKVVGCGQVCFYVCMAYNVYSSCQWDNCICDLSVDCCSLGRQSKMTF